MSGQLGQVTGHRSELLSAGWEISASPPGAITGPELLSTAPLDWSPTVAPSTAASSLRACGKWSLDGPTRNFDADDWWYRTRFNSEPLETGEQLWLCFRGLATVSDVWLNGVLLFSSQSMFVAHEHRVDGIVRPENEIVIRFRSIDAILSERRPRPRWRAPLVANQQMRWLRSTLLGRIPGWSPPAATAGPWRDVRLERRRYVDITSLRMDADASGQFNIACKVTSLDRMAVTDAEVILEREGRAFQAPLSRAGSDGEMSGQLLVPDVEPWWPHTHGQPSLYSAQLRMNVAGTIVQAELGAIGFRSINLVTHDSDFALHVNGAPVFCRGACWTPIDPVSLAAAPDDLSHAFGQVVDAGMNMLRVCGTMVYESNEFLDECDARGVLLWQDFMFANLDYPAEDEAFLRLVDIEVSQQLARLQGRPALAVLCGGSEVEQQAAMWATPRERWSPRLFHERIAALARDACPSVPYWPSSAHGGDFPHQGNVGSTSWFAVGAYMRPLEDARRSEVRFASECLAFANVPDPESTADLPAGKDPKVHHPGWKLRAPRDAGAGWDFDDVRDFYLAALYRVDPLQLRYADHDRYLALGRAVTGEVMATVFSEWRRQRSVTRGGLIWFLRDLWPGAGWGIIDASGNPKAAWHYLRRALSPLAISLSDEGCNGLYVHIVNDLPTTLQGELEISVFNRWETPVFKGVQTVQVAPRSAVELNAAQLFDSFLDLTYAYRFGPPSHDVVVATLRDTSGGTLRQAFYFTRGMPNAFEADIGLSARACMREDGGGDLVIRTRKFAQSISIEAPGFVSDDNYFHMAPGQELRVGLQRTDRGNRSPHAQVPRGSVRALNAEAPAPIMVDSSWR